MTPMKQKLRLIYAALSSGEITKEAALESIKAIKLETRDDDEVGVVLAVPGWQAGDAARASSPLRFNEHHVLLCELPKIDAEALSASLPDSRCQSLPMEPQRNIAERYAGYALVCFEHVKALLQSRAEGMLLVQIVVADGQEQTLFAGLSALLKTATLENPQCIGQLILVPRTTSTNELAAQLQDETLHTQDAMVKYGKDGRRVWRLQEVPLDDAPPRAAFKDQGVYLITGGLGGLGRLFAKEILAQTRDARLVLTGRAALDEDKRALLAALSAQSDRVSYRQVDLGDPDQVTGLIASIREAHGRLDGILHAAGMTADNFILKKTAAELTAVLAPKVAGTRHLDEASRELGLDFFVMFSSFASAVGNVGQADYAMANAFMDQFAAYRNDLAASGQRQGHALSIQWPLWQDGGMAIDPSGLEHLRRTTGIQPMRTATGLDAFSRGLALRASQMLVLEGDAAQMRGTLLDTPGNIEPQAFDMQVLPHAVTMAPASMDAGTLTEKTQEYLRKEFSGILKLAANRIDPQAALEAYGIDSILAMKLTNQLELTFGSLSKTLFFEYQTVRELTDYFVGHHAARLNALFASAAGQRSEATGIGSRQPVAQAAIVTQDRAVQSRRPGRGRTALTTTTTVANDEPVAIIGLSGRYPEAIDINAYWRNLRDGKDCIVEVPKDRWDWREYFSEDRTEAGRHYSKWGGFIAGVDEFDPLFFNISPKEAKLIDPQERLFLQHAWMAVEDAGYTRESLQIPDQHDLAGQVGVYVGLMYNEYQLFGAESSLQGAPLGITASAASIANRVSYAMNLHGPSMTLDTMCSSSLTAIHIACQDLKQGRTSLAIAGGVNVSVHPNKYLVLSTGQFISSDGHCQSFGEGGDGYIPGEGVGAVVLKRLSEAQRDGDHIYGLIRGSALNHGGKTNGYTVPNPQAQAGAISRALKESRIDARQVGYIEAHGTGTKLGDPIEIAALNKAFQSYTRDTGFCLIGSAKSNIGHCESAAGIAGLTKVLLQMRHRQIVPSLHSERLNPHIDFDRSPFVVNQSLRDWDAPVIDGRVLPRIAGISSFGAGGSNAHMLIEEYNVPVEQPVTHAQVVVVLSARTAEQLRQKARELLAFVRSDVDAIDLTAMAYTLQVGREAMDERLGFVVSTAVSLAEKLDAVLAGEQGIDEVYEGQAKRNRDALALFGSDTDLQQTVEKWIANRKLSKLAELWAKGLNVDWSRLYGAARPRRVSLPTYPFAKERYWIDMPAGGRGAAMRGATTAVLHPLLHANTSDLRQQRYSSTFDGEEFFAGMDGSAQKILPAVAYFEMARAAIAQAMPERQEAMMLELRDMVWAQPVVLVGNTRVDIALLAQDDGRVDFEIYSGMDAQEIIHCQGRGLSMAKTTPERLDLAQLRAQTDRDSHQVLVELRMPKAAEQAAGDYVLHPGLMGDAMRAAAALIDDGSGAARLPFSLETLRVLAPCAREMLAWVRHAPGSEANETVVKLDIDLCDRQGNVCVQLRGVGWRHALRIEAERPQAHESLVSKQALAVPMASPVVAAQMEAKTLAVAAPLVAAPLPKRIEFMASRPVAIVEAEKKKPAGIALSAPAASMSASAPVASRAPIALRHAALGTVVSKAEISSVELHGDGQGVYSIRVATPDGANVLSESLIDHLLQALAHVRQDASAKVLTIAGTTRGFLRGDREASNAAQPLYRAIVALPCPVIAVVEGDATGAGFLAAALCDLMVLGEEASYGFIDPSGDCWPSAMETSLFVERFGEVLAQDLLFASTLSTGLQLRTKGWTCPIVPATQVDAHAQTILSELATKPALALRLLKQHLVRPLVEAVAALTPMAAPATDVVSAKHSARIVSPAKHVHVETIADTVLSIRFRVSSKKVGAKELLADLGPIFAKLQRSAYKAVVLASDYPAFLPGTSKTISENTVLGFQRMLEASRVPVVVALEGHARGHAWLVAQCCDASVYNVDGLYSTAEIGAGLTNTAIAVFTQRFGIDAGREILLSAVDASGADLQQRVPVLGAVSQGQVLSTAIALARQWATLPSVTLAEWKARSADAIQRRMQALPAMEVGSDETGALEISGPTQVALMSTVVSVIAHPDGVVVVKMEDRQAKNMFSDAFMAGMEEAFAHIERTPGYKAVVLTGYDNYFASGGTKDSLLAIQGGQVSFTDHRVFESARKCRLPVIAAMQGHGIGAGWTLGMFADAAILAEESRYVSPYMNYGFTPGAGATWILADKLGRDLSWESLLTAQYVSGSELKARGARIRVLPKAEVLSAAMTLAQTMARASRGRLIALKRRLNAYMDAPLEATYRHELSMHDETFVGRSETLAQIERSFDAESETGAQTQSAPVAVPQPSTTSVRIASVDNLSSVAATLRMLLANELHLSESDIDDHTQFIDLGMDSISGVTWIRRINERYGTSIDATKVYSHPTLAQLSRHVQDELGALRPTIMPSPANSTAADHSAPHAPLTVQAIARDGLSDVAAVLRSLLAAELHLGEGDIDEHTQFIDLGLDSISGVTWIRRINEHYGTSIDATKVYSHPTLAQLSRHVNEEAGNRGNLPTVDAMPAPAEQPQPQPTMSSVPQTSNAVATSAIEPLVSWRSGTGVRLAVDASVRRTTQAIAVIGMAGQFPKAGDIDEFWRNIAEGRDCMTQVPAERWDPETYFRAGDPVAGKTYCQWLGALEEYDRFDPLFFNLSPREAESMDPQQRLFLQTCWHTIENAGYDARALSGSKCGVFVGCAYGDYHLLSREQQLSAIGFTGDATSILAARISYFLNLQGPCVSIDTACSSSLVAISQACDSLNTGASDLALAGGVYVMAGPEMHIKTSQGGMLSPEGRCFTFDQRADGFALGEGVGAIMLKRVADAERDHDIILGVIEGWGVNQDGKTNGITAPNPESQTRLEQDVYDRYAIDPAGIQLIEAHGTGTKLGDPIEVEALKQSFKKYTQNTDYCALGSVKSNIGHCLTAAGAAGVIKLLLALKHRQLPPTAQFENLNEHIRLEGSPFYVNSRLREWTVQGAQRRRAAISSFGFSGTNAHMVLAEYVPTARAATPVSAISQEGKVIVPLSAKTPDQLKQKARDLLRFLRREEASVDLFDVAYTLQTGREAMDERVGFLAGTISQLAERIEAYVDGVTPIKDFHQGQVKRSRESLSLINQDDEMKSTIVDKWIAKQRLTKLLDLWVKGLEFDWNRLYGDARPQRIALPGYPFAKDRYWITPAPSEVKRNTAGAASVALASIIHPLLHTNTSDFSGQSYRSVFSGAEDFLERRGDSLRSLPEMASLEMVRAAIAHAAPGRSESLALEIRDVEWAGTIGVREDTHVGIALCANDHGRIDYEIFCQADVGEVIHASGHARLIGMPAPRSIDLDGVKASMGPVDLDRDSVGETFEILKSEHQAIVRLRLPERSGNDSEVFAIPPALMQGALFAAIALTGKPARTPGHALKPVALASLRLLSWCVGDMSAWVRRSEESVFDIDLCDERGNVCVEMLGMQIAESSVDGDAGMDAPTRMEEAAQSLCFEEYWEEQSSDVSMVSVESTRLLVFADGDFIEAAGKSDDASLFSAAEYVVADEGDRQLSGRIHRCRFDDADAIRDLLDHACDTSQPSPVTLVYAWAKGRRDAGLHAIFDLFKVIAASARPVVHVVLVGGYDESNVASCWDYAWIGFERSLKSVLPKTRVSVLLTDSVQRVPEQVAETCRIGGVVRYAGEKRYGLACRPTVSEAAARAPFIKEGGSYLITGGGGALGLKFAQYLAEHHRAELHLLGRRPISSSMREQLDALVGMGAKAAHYHDVDVADQAALGAWAKALPGNLSGIIHAAGVESGQPFHRKSAAEIDAVLVPKIAGTLALGDAFDEQALDFVCYFSSAAASFGDLGSCDYAIANRFQMAYAAYRQRCETRRGKTVVINWPLWEEGGMGRKDDALASAYLKMSAQEFGNEPLATRAGIDLWLDIMAADRMQTLVMVGKPARTEKFLLKSYQTRRAAPTVAVDGTGVPAGVTGMPQATTRSATTGRIDQRRLQDELRAGLAATLKMKVSGIALDCAFGDLGMDSFIGLEWIAAINATYGTSLPNIVIYDYPCISALAAHLLGEIAKLPAHEVEIEESIEEVAHVPGHIAPVPQRSPRLRDWAVRPAKAGNRTASGQKIAIVGMSGKYPQANDLSEYWHNLAAGKDAVVEIPAWRWDADRYYDPDQGRQGATNSKWLGAMEGIDAFDPLFFRISPHEAVYMDPQHRLFLQESYKAFENAGYSTGELNNRKCGVYLGIGSNEYSMLLSKHGTLATTVTGNSNAIAAARIAYYLNLKGPAICIDTACSSSLVAIHLACQGLSNRETDMALAGGVSLWFSPESFLAMTRAGMLSADGKCKAFDDSADGIVVGDGVGAVVLKRLEDAEADNDCIYGVIIGSGVNQDGRTNGITAPSVNSQTELLRDVYSRYSIDPGTIGYVEAHGTGTKLGDPIELTALATVFNEKTAKRNYCGIGSVKSNIGHTTSAAGVASVHKVLLSMRHRMLAPSLHVSRENTRFDFVDSPFFVCREKRAWDAVPGTPRRAAVSSFGYSGTNAHLVIEEYASAASAERLHPPAQKRSSLIVPLSARTAEQLREKVGDLLRFIRDGQSADASLQEDSVLPRIDLASMAYTLQVGREAMEARLALVVDSVEELSAKLNAFLEGEPGGDNTFRGFIESGEEGMKIVGSDEEMHAVIEQWLSQGKSSKLAELWVQGVSIEWKKLYGAQMPARIGLPAYPFARERYWADAVSIEADSSGVGSAEAEPGRGGHASAEDRAIEELVGRIESDAIETAQAVRLLKMLV